MLKKQTPRVKKEKKKDKRTVNTTEYIPRESCPSKASAHVSAASYNAARSSVILYFFFHFFDMKYIAAAPAYSTVVFSAKPKLPKKRIDKRSG